MESLTREDIAALRAADDVSFHATFANSAHGGNVGHISANTRERRDGNRITRESSYEIEVAAIGFATKGKTRAFVMIHSAKFASTWQTTVAALRVGDRLTLRFYADYGTNGYVSDANLHVDTLFLVVQRDSKSGKVTRHEYWVDTNVTPDNTARMFQ